MKRDDVPRQGQTDAEAASSSGQALSAWANSSKARSSISAPIPMPVSRTLIAA